MTAEKSRKEIEIAELAFNGVVFALLGYVMLAAMNLQVKASLRFWVITTLPGMVVIGFSLRRCRRHWPSFPANRNLWWAMPGGMDWRTLVGGLGLLALGSMFGLLAGGGSPIDEGLFAVAASIIPWWKIRLLHRNFAAACLVAPVGAVLTLLTTSALIPWINYAIAAWVLFLVATVSAMTSPWRSTSAASNKHEQQENETAVGPII